MPGDNVQPTAFNRRSFHYRTLESSNASFMELAGSAIASSFGRSIEAEREQAREIGLADLSPLPRTGFKGKRALSWLKQTGLSIGDTNNFCWNQEDRSIVARLADTEALILSDITCKSNICADLESRQSTEEPNQCYQVPRMDASAWFLITGNQADIMFAKLCGIDLRRKKFANGAIAQTSVARMNAIVIRNDIGDLPVYHILFDSASADYLWRVLMDAMAEFDGMPIGYKAIIELMGNHA